jgi:hypothetical protein
VSGTHVMVYGLSGEIEFTSATDVGAAPDLIMRDVRDTMQGNGRAANRSCGNRNACYEVDWSFRAFLEVMFLAPPMVIYLRTDAAQSDSLAKVIVVQRVAGASGLQREKVITDEMVCDDMPLHLLLGYSDVEAERMRGGIHLYWKNILIIPFFCCFAIKNGMIGIANVSPPPSCLLAQLMPHPDPPCVHGTGGLPFGKSREGGLRKGRLGRTAVEFHAGCAAAAGGNL